MSLDPLNHDFIAACASKALESPTVTGRLVALLVRWYGNNEEVAGSLSPKKMGTSCSANPTRSAQRLHSGCLSCFACPPWRSDCGC